MIPRGRIVAAIDFSEPSRIALMFADRLAQHAGAELHVVHAVDPLLAVAAQERGVEITADVQDEMQSFANTARRTPLPLAAYHVFAGTAIEAINELALRVSADVVVVGARGLSGTERWMFGSTTEGLLRRADLSVLVVPETWTPPDPDSSDLSGMGPVVVGLDLSTGCPCSLAAAVPLAEMLHTGIVMLHVVAELPVSARWRSDAETVLRRRVTDAAARLATIAKQLPAKHEVRLELQTGSIARRLTEVATALPQSLLVLGRTARNAGTGPPGAIAYRVLMGARVPVLMHVSRRRPDHRHADRHTVMKEA